MAKKALFAKQTFPGFASDPRFSGLYARSFYFPESGQDSDLTDPFSIEVGETYYVDWDGEEFEVVGQDSGAIIPGSVVLGNASDFGLSGNNEPFAILWTDVDLTFASTTDTATSHTVGIYQEVAVEEPEEEHTGNVLATLFQDQANAIREGLGPIGTFVPVTFAAKIREINKLIGTGGSSDDVRYVTFMSEDGSEELCVKTVAKGDDCADTADLVARGLMETPTKESTAQYNYVHAGWATEPNGALDANALKSVTEDRTVYANFAAVTRYYTVRFYDGDTLLETMQVPYGGAANYTPEKDGYGFDGWIPSNTNITGDTDCYAQWTEGLTFASAKSWAEISEICESGQAADYFNVGDVREFKNGETLLEARILALNTDDKADGSGKAGITMKVTKRGRVALGSSAFAKSNGSSWTSSYLYENDANLLSQHLPSDLKSVVKTVSKRTKYTSAMGQSDVTKPVNYFIPSVYEVQPKSALSNLNDSAQYPDFVTVENRYVFDESGNQVDWWLRNTYTNGAYYHAANGGVGSVANATLTKAYIVCCCI